MSCSKIAETPIAIVEHTIEDFGGTRYRVYRSDKEVELLGFLWFGLRFSKNRAEGGNAESFSLFLTCRSRDRYLDWGNHEVEADLQILKAGGAPITQRLKSVYSMEQNLSGYQVDLEALLGSGRQYVVDGQLKLVAKIYSVSTSNPQKEVLRMVRDPVIPPTVLETFLEMAVGSDVTFVAKDGSEVMAHWGILIATSPVFKAMYEAPMREANTREISLEDMSSAHSIKTFLKCVYTGSLSHMGGVELKVVKEVVNAAEKYELEALKLGAGMLLQEHCDPGNAVHLLNFAKRYGLGGTENWVREYIKTNVDAVMDNTPDPDME